MIENQSEQQANHTSVGEYQATVKETKRKVMYSYVEKSTFAFIYFIRKTSTSTEVRTCISYISYIRRQVLSH